jgi:AcrR family transcriptional regulator
LYIQPMDSEQKPSDQPLRADAQRNRKLLIEVAQSSIAEIGLETPLEDIARRAKVGIGTLYRHFPTRMDLLEAVCEDQRETLIRLADELRDSPSPADAFLSWLQAAIEKMMDFRALKFVMVNDFAEGKEKTQAWMERMQQAVHRLQEAAEESGEIRRDLDTGSIFRLMNAIALAAEKAKDPGAEAKLLLEMLVDGIRSKKGKDERERHSPPGNA